MVYSGQQLFVAEYDYSIHEHTASSPLAHSLTDGYWLVQTFLYFMLL